MEKVSLYIPCFNAQSYLRECLDSVFRQTYAADEVLVIDDGSTDASVRIAESYPVRVISQGRNLGLAVARNTALCESRNEFIASLDADCLADPDWLEILMANLVSNDLIGAGGRLIEKNISGIADKWRSAHMGQDLGDQLRRVNFLYGSNCLFRKKALFTVGLYRQEFNTNYEDINISERLTAYGFKMVYDPKAIVKHLRKDSIGSVLRTYWRWCLYMHVTPKNRGHFSRRAASRLVMVVGNFEKFARRDIEKRNLALLIVDIIYLFYSFWLDACFLMRRGLKNG